MSKLISAYKFLFLALICISILAIPELSLAAAQQGGQATADSNDIITILCNVIKFITGGIGKTIAIIILISLAISMFLGKVSWGMAIAVAVGMGILFGAPTVINAITAGVGGNAQQGGGAAPAQQLCQ